MSTILVTGGSGFIGSHIIIKLLAGGHKVRTTIRNRKREGFVRSMLKQNGIKVDDNLSFFVANLENDAGWVEAVTGCDYVLHVASPFPMEAPKHEDELIIPAREGTLRVLRAARDAGVKRVVLTSSFAAIGYGHKQRSKPFDESDWTDLNSKEVTAYAKSKTLTELAAWNFISREGNGLELSVINPVWVFGPVIGSDYSPSTIQIQRMLNGTMPGCPNIYLGGADVRDVADLHITAMTHPAAKGERFLSVAGDFIPMPEITKILKRSIGNDAQKVSTRQLPNWLVRISAQFNPTVKQIVPELGKTKNATSAKARELLDWSPRSIEESIIATAQSIIKLGL